MLKISSITSLPEFAFTTLTVGNPSTGDIHSILFGIFGGVRAADLRINTLIVDQIK